MPTEPPTNPKDVADMLESLARRIRNSASFAPPPGPSRGLEVRVPPGADSTPAVGEVDVFTDATHVMVTAETHNADAATLHVSIVDGRLLINLGQGVGQVTRDLLLPAPVDEEQAYATFRNGILDVVLPRKPRAGA